ncbi:MULTISPECIES: hypothetical protein [unclassified Actinomadura]|uniref:hypothetical protein n=1 Tax=unclassified Actinomadura TaxID=2626254 RepID=UPI0011EF3564|nr:hypothetical protein [Actinomadura sp. K4S16]
MSDQPGDVLDEAAKLFDALMKRVGGGGRGEPAGREEPAGDVWDRAIAEESAEGAAGGPAAGGHGPRIATGAPECRDCPVCRAIAIKRESGGDVGRHLREAGRSLFAAALDVVAAFERTGASGGAGSGSSGSGRAGSDRAASDRTRPPEGSEGARAGTSDRSERPDPGDPWSAATGGGPIDIG